jgi:hypothetical protein
MRNTSLFIAAQKTKLMRSGVAPENPKNTSTKHFQKIKENPLFFDE